jgi:hypothetical protein
MINPQDYAQRFSDLENRVKILEFIRRNPTHLNPEIGMREAAARAQAVPPDFVSRRSDFEAISDMGTFIRRLLSPEDLGYAVTAEVRALARKALGLP